MEYSGKRVLMDHVVLYWNHRELFIPNVHKGSPHYTRYTNITQNLSTLAHQLVKCAIILQWNS